MEEARRGPQLHLTTAAIAFDDDEYDIGDLVLLALAEGDWQATERRLARGLALAAEHGHGVAPSRVEAELTRFRYARRLISGKELREWLAQRSLALAALRRHCLRAVLVEEHGAAGARAGVAEVGAELPADVCCSGTLARAARRLGELAAMACVSGPGDEPPDAAPLLAAAAAHATTTGLDAFSATDLQRRTMRVLTLLRAEAAFVRDAAPAKDVRSCLARHGVDWLALECSQLTVGGEGAAREAMLCLRVDATPLAQLAAQLGRPIDRRALYVGDTGPATAPLLASAAAGDAIGPLRDDDEGWRVLVVDRRVPPSEDDPELVARATDELVQALRERVRAGRVRELAAL